MQPKPHFPEKIVRVDNLFGVPIAFSRLLGEIPLAILILGLDRCIIALNHRAEVLTGFTQDQVKGLPCSHVLRNNFCLQGCPLDSMGPDSEPVRIKGNIINRDRQKISVQSTLSPITDLDGKLVGFMETVEDLRALEGLDRLAGNASYLEQLISQSQEMERIFQIIPGIAQTDSSVLITGETGTGKDLVAEAIHLASNRAKGPFIKVNCGALPETLLESELFGHQKGAFTGAVESKPGRFRLAHNGTLFLTEIGDLPVPLQVKLLTFLDDKRVYPLGSSRGHQVDVRIIAATHRDLAAMVQRGRFRQDLLFRLNVVRMHLPPLRERSGDIRLLLEHFLRVFAARFKKPLQGFSRKALDRLLTHDYPGNVRELRNIVEYAVNICTEKKIQLQHLPTYLFEKQASISPAPTRSPQQPGREVGATGDPHIRWGDVERKIILDALIKAKGRRTQAAEFLGWGRSTLWRKMKQYGISAE